MKLFEDQEQLVAGTARMIGSGVRKVVSQLPTGGGKTVIFSAISHRYIKKSGKRVLILVHRKELLEQTRCTAFEYAGLICQPIKAGMKWIPDAEIYVGMVESVNRRIPKLPEIGLVIIDECHRLEFMKLHEHFPTQYIIGFTATPLTVSKKKPLKNYYDDIVCGPSIPDLIKNNRLCQNITWAPKEVVNRLELAMKGDDFDEIEMAKAFSKSKYIHNTVSAYKRWGDNTKAIVFNVNIFHSTEVTKAFVEAGLPCQHLDGETPSEERRKILQWFKTTPNAILCNVGIANVGFDEPTIETVIVNKATASMPNWLQMCGRGSRVIDNDFISKRGAQYPYQVLPKSMFRIIDMGGNAVTHGDWCYSRDWYDIFHNPPKQGKATAAPSKTCPNCQAIIPASARVCPYCGYVYPAKSIPIEVDLHDFIVVTKGIDVNQIIETNRHRKEYYALFQIGRVLAEQSKKTVPEMSDEYANFILEKYYELGHEWTKAKGKRFNKWHQVKCAEVLFNDLKLKYPKWGAESALVKHYVRDNTVPDHNVHPLEPIRPIQNL